MASSLPQVVAAPDPCRIFRIVHLDNLAQIVQQGGVWCGNEVASQGLPYTSIGNGELTLKRASRSVSVAANGSLNDYVPFYFCPRSVMLFQIERRHPSTYGGGQEPVVHLVTTVDRVRAAGSPCFFTTHHAYSRYAEQIEDFSRLDELDWETLQSNYWANTQTDPDRMERKMAEFLAHRFVPLSCFVGIGVYNERVRQEAAELLEGSAVPPHVKVVPKWYY